MISDPLNPVPSPQGNDRGFRQEDSADQLAFYYGTEYPSLAAAEHYRGIIVLQPYHPLVVGGQFAAIFPHAQRYLYFNPVKTFGKETLLTFSLDGSAPLPSALPMGGGGTPSGFDLRAWLGSQRDLERAKLAEACQLMDIAGTCGLFVDDIDHWLVENHRFDQGLGMLTKIAQLAGERLILNRGFRFWPELTGLDAVVLENLGPHDIAQLSAPGHDQDLKWLHRQLSSYLPALSSGQGGRKRPVPAYSLSYAADGAWPPCDEAYLPLYEGIKALLDRYVVGNIQAQQALDRWSDPFNTLG